MGNIKSLGRAVLVARSSNHRRSGQVFGDGWKVIRSKQTRRNEEMLQRMKGVKRVDKPLPGLKVETHVVFGKVTEHIKCELRALELLTATYENLDIRTKCCKQKSMTSDSRVKSTAKSG